MSIPSITGTGRASPTTPDTPAPIASAEQQGAAAAASVIDQLTQLPTPPRFPWLSRLSQELEQAARQKPAFPPAPMLGDNLDRTA